VDDHKDKHRRRVLQGDGIGRRGNFVGRNESADGRGIRKCRDKQRNPGDGDTPSNEKCEK
jgi:hypothetical protein